MKKTLTRFHRSLEREVRRHRILVAQAHALVAQEEFVQARLQEERARQEEEVRERVSAGQGTASFALERLRALLERALQASGARLELRERHEEERARALREARVQEAAAQRLLLRIARRERLQRERREQRELDETALLGRFRARRTTGETP